MEDEHEYNVLDAIRDLTHTDRAFFSMVRFLEGSTRNHVVAGQLRNTSQAMGILRLFMASNAQRQTERIVLNIPLQSILDPSGNIMQSFLDPVPVVPTREQIQAATDNHIQVTDTTCSICQEPLTCATRIRNCGHCFHSQCINEWFTMNTRCPMCRHDIRNLHHTPSNNTNDSSVHTNQE